MAAIHSTPPPNRGGISFRPYRRIFRVGSDIARVLRGPFRATLRDGHCARSSCQRGRHSRRVPRNKLLSAGRRRHVVGGAECRLHGFMALGRGHDHRSRRGFWCRLGVWPVGQGRGNLVPGGRGGVPFKKSGTIETASISGRVRYVDCKLSSASHTGSYWALLIHSAHANPALHRAERHSARRSSHFRPKSRTSA